MLLILIRLLLTLVLLLVILVRNIWVWIDKLRLVILNDNRMLFFIHLMVWDFRFNDHFLLLLLWLRWWKGYALFLRLWRILIARLSPSSLVYLLLRPLGSWSSSSCSFHLNLNLIYLN